MVATQIPFWRLTKLRQSRDWTQASSPRNLQRKTKQNKRHPNNPFSCPACGCCLPSGSQKPQAPSKTHGPAYNEFAPLRTTNKPFRATVNPYADLSLIFSPHYYAKNHAQGWKCGMLIKHAMFENHNL